MVLFSLVLKSEIRAALKNDGISMKRAVGIMACGYVGAEGLLPQKELFSLASYIKSTQIEQEDWLIASLGEEGSNALKDLTKERKPYRKLDRSVLMAILTARMVKSQYPVKSGTVGINIGSSRGATEAFEHHHQHFLEADKSTTSAFTSPTTTLGNISSWVMDDLGWAGPVLSHSITCSTTIQGLANGMAWLKAGMADYFLAGGSEAPLTSFTLHQMKALGIYAEESTEIYPCQPLNTGEAQPHGMVLGAGSASFLLQNCEVEQLGESNPMAVVESVGLGNEPLEGFTGISDAGTCFQRSMQMALRNQLSEAPVDMILMHAPGTNQGDQAELNAIEAIFGNQTPYLYSTKWKQGHTFGASAALGLYLALQCLKYQKTPEFPYGLSFKNQPPALVRKIMINAAGFGGNAGSIVVSLPDMFR